MNRFTTLFFGLAIGIVLSGAASADVVPVPQTVAAEKIEGAKPRNVVFILSDDHRYDAMSFMNHPLAKTPHMDAMAKNGAHLKNAFVSTSLCSPSRASILTGLYTFRHRVIDNQRAVPDGTLFFPQYLQDAGYFLYVYYWEQNYPQTPTHFSLRGIQYKYTTYYGVWDSDELFDIRRDPMEQDNLIHKPDFQKTKNQMQSRLYTMMDELGGMQIPLNAPRGRQQNKRLRDRGGVKAADFPEAFIVDEPIRKELK